MNECLSVWRKTWSWIAFLFHATLGGALLVSVCIGSGFADMGKFWSVFVIGGLALAFLGTALWLYAPSVAGNYEMRRKKEDFWDIMTGFGILLLFAGPAYVAMYAEMKNRPASGAVSEFFRSQPSFAKATEGLFSSPSSPQQAAEYSAKENKKGLGRQ